MAKPTVKGSGLEAYQRAVAALAAGGLLPIYCFAGPEAFLRREGIAALSLASGVSDLNYAIIEEEAGLGEALYLARTPSFGGMRLVVYTAEKLKAPEKKALAAYAAAPATGSHLALSLAVAEAEPSFKDGFVPCPAPEPAERLVWITKRAAALGFSLDRAGMNLLAARTATGNLDRLEQELGKLSTFADAAALGADEVAALVGEAKVTRAFQLVDNLGERDAAAALRTLHLELRAGGSALGILGGVAWQMRLMLAAKGYLMEGLSEKETGERLEAHPFVVRQTLHRVRRFSLEELLAGHGYLCRADRELKKGADPRLTLEMTILRFLQSGP